VKQDSPHFNALAMAGIQARGFGVDDQQHPWGWFRLTGLTGRQGRQFKFGRCNGSRNWLWIWIWSGCWIWSGNNWCGGEPGIQQGVGLVIHVPAPSSCRRHQAKQVVLLPKIGLFPHLSPQELPHAPR
jgi:hypothetical protein